MKPISCGDRQDAEILWAASDRCLPLDEVNPIFLSTAAAPMVAAALEGQPIDTAAIREAFARVKQRHEAVIVEGVGGWRVPITSTYFVSDLAADLGLPVAIVVENKLGAINHTILTVEAIKQQGLTCAGLILNRRREHSDEMCQVPTATNREVLESLVKLPILFEISCGQRSLTSVLRPVER